MAVFKYVNIKVALQKIMRDLGYTRTSAHEFPWQDSIEWIGEALQQIGAYSQYDAKEVTIKIENNKGKLPCDFIHMKKILNADFNQPQGIADFPNSDLLVNNIDTADEQENRLEGSAITNFDYNIVLDNIITKYKTGNVKIKYLAMPVDDDGFPVIPDNESYKEAFFWKVSRQLAIRGQLKNRELTYDKCDSEWQWYCGQARAEGNALTHAQRDLFSESNQNILPLGYVLNNMVSTVTAVSSFSNI